MADVSFALQRLNLNIIPQAWVDAVWDLEFTEKALLDNTIEEELTASGHRALQSLFQCLLDYTADQEACSDGTTQSIWAILGENGISVKCLLAALSFFVLTAKSKMANVSQRVSSLHAASIYLLLLGMPGSIANKVFHEVLLDTCSDLSSHCWPLDCGKKRKKDVPKSSQTEGKRSKPPRKDSQEMDEASEDEEEEEELHFSGQDLVKIRGAVVLLVQSLLRLLQVFPLKDRQQSIGNCAQIFSKLLYFEPVSGELSFADVQDVRELKNLPQMAFCGLKLLCSPKHGDQKESLRKVFHQLLYVILMMNKVSRGKPTLLVPSHSILAARDQALNFVCHLVDELKEQAQPLLHILQQHLCFQMVEKSEFRNRGAQAVGVLTSRMTNTDYSLFIKWLFTFSKHAKMVHRLFSVDVVMALLDKPERRPEKDEDPELVCFLQQKFLIQDILFARRMDESPTVQGHALSCLAQCLELPSFNATQAVHSLFAGNGTQTVLDSDVTGETLSLQSSAKTYGTLPFRTVELSNADSSADDAKENVALLLRRVKDSKTNVRKSALQALVGLLKHNVMPLNWTNLETLSERSRDPAVSVKKTALDCVGELLSAKPENVVVQKAWLYGVLPAVMDSESSVQDKALEGLEQVLLSQVKRYSADCHLNAGQRLAWDLLLLLCDECQNLCRYFSRALTIWSKQNKLTQTFITNLIYHTEAEHAAGAWLLLSKVVSLSPKLPIGKIVDAWDMMASSKNMNATTCCHIMSVVGDIAEHLNEDTKQRITTDLMSWLKAFTLSLELISAAVETLCQFGRCEDITQTQEFLKQHCGELVAVCETYLANIILSENRAENLDEELMIKHLHTLGVALLQCPADVGRRTVLLVESVLTSHSDQLAGCQTELPASQPLSQFRVNSLPTRVRAHGVITLGKLCLQHEGLIQKYLPVFARELEVGTEVAVRNNVVVVMCDLCIRYTNIVDHYIPNISACLRDSEAVIREQTLIMLTNLLQDEFVKWKGSLFFRFMVTLVDPDPAIARLCEYCLVHLLLKKNPEMFSQHFIECIFHFNSYSQHKTYNMFPQSEREKIRFSLKGDQFREKRFWIYRFLLQHFTDAQRFNISNKINQTVLACFADEELLLDADGAEILSETFKILSLKEMKLQAVFGPAGGAAGEDTEEENVPNMAKAVLQVAQKKVVSQVQKKAFIENTVPLIISLKNLLEQKRSSVVKELMAYLQVTMQDYRHEVKEFFSGDEQLAAEVEFALATAEKEREMQKQMDGCSLASGVHPQGSPTRFRPSMPFNFTTPQPPRPTMKLTSVPLTDCSRRERRALNEEPVAVLSKSIPLEGTVIARGAVVNRAISTPKGVNFNLTFEEGLSAIFSDHGTSAAEESSVLHMTSNQPQAPGLRRWNVQSPLRQKKKPSRV
ncbi:unnamed protein product [Ophioblennius macclurei]